MIAHATTLAAVNGTLGRVLVVEDDDYSATAITDELEDANYDVLVATNGNEALHQMDGQDCPIIVSDWNMPSLNGLELCRAIREKSGSDYHYFIMLTCRSDHDDIVRGMAAGADDFLVKPWSSDELRMRVDVGRRIVSHESYDLVVAALMRVVELRCAETGAHLRRVQKYAQLLATRLAELPQFAGQLDVPTVSLIRQASPLHDIGKIAISDWVLGKPGPLSASERQHMIQHTILGAETLEDALSSFPRAKSFMQIARDIALTHHEKYDGTGYPCGLAGDEIPLAGRIVAVCDVYDAMTSPRVYKEAYSHEVARDYVTAEANRSFDPDVVAAFLSLEHRFKAIRQRFPD